MTKQRKTGQDHWTQIMDHCYNRNCICSGCTFLEYASVGKTKKCYVKNAIVNYIKKYGVGPEIKTKGIIEE